MESEENSVPISQGGALENGVIADMYREAVRKGQALWFQVASGSMHPMLRVGEQVYIQPATADQLHVGEIAAFEIGAELIIHRIVRRHLESGGIQLTEMSDVHLRPGRVESAAVIGRVVAIRQGSRYIDLQHPIAQKCGRVTARARYRFHTMRFKNKLAQVIIRKGSRLVARLGSWCTRRFCTSSQPYVPTNSVSN